MGMSENKGTPKIPKLKMWIRMYVCMHVCMHVCINIYIYIHMYIFLWGCLRMRCLFSHYCTRFLNQKIETHPYFYILLCIFFMLFICIIYMYTDWMFRISIVLGIWFPPKKKCKPLDSLLCREQLQKLQTLKSIRMVKKYRDSQGRKRVVGNLGLLHFLLTRCQVASEHKTRSYLD